MKLFDNRETAVRCANFLFSQVFALAYAVHDDGLDKGRQVTEDLAGLITEFDIQFDELDTNLEDIRAMIGYVHDRVKAYEKKVASGSDAEPETVRWVPSQEMLELASKDQAPTTSRVVLTKANLPSAARRHTPAPKRKMTMFLQKLSTQAA